MTRGDDPFRHGCALVDVDASTGVLRAGGADARGYLQRQVSADLARVTATRGARSTLMSRKGKMIAAFEVYALGSDLCLVCERAALAAMADGLERLVILEDVTFARDAERVVSVQGPEAGAVLGRGFPGCAPPVEELAVTPWENGDGTLIVARRARSALGGYDFVCAGGALDSVRTALVDAGAAPVDEFAAEAARIDAGIPRYGIDADDRNLPPESGYDDAVSYDKGCYVGQEVVARIRTYGHVNQRLRRLRFPDEHLPDVDAAIATDQKTVGRVTSRALSPVTGNAVALGYVRYEIDPGARVWVPIGGQRVAVVVEAL